MNMFVCAAFGRLLNHIFAVTHRIHTHSRRSLRYNFSFSLLLHHSTSDNENAKRVLHSLSPVCYFAVVAAFYSIFRMAFVFDVYTFLSFSLYQLPSSPIHFDSSVCIHSYTANGKKRGRKKTEYYNIIFLHLIYLYLFFPLCFLITFVFFPANLQLIK